MNREGQELLILLKNLDLIVGEIQNVLCSTRSAPHNRKDTPYFLSKTNNSDLERIIVKINKYKKLRTENCDLYNIRLAVTFLMDIFAQTKNLVKQISEGRSVVAYSDKGFFNRFSDISHEIERLIA